MLFYEGRHFSPNFLRLKRRYSLSVDILLVRKQYFPKLNPVLLTQKWEKKNPFQAILRLKKTKGKKRKKVAWTTNSLGGGGGQNLSGRSTKKNFFMCMCLSTLTAYPVVYIF